MPIDRGGAGGRDAQKSWRAGTIQAEFANLEILVATQRDETGELLVRELQRARANVRHLWPLPDRLPEGADVIFVDLAPGLATRIPWVPGEAKAALVAIIPPFPPPDLDLLRKCAPDAVLHRPFTTHAVLTSLVLARSHFTYDRRLRGRVDKLDDTLRAIRSVERAKSILMAKENIGEDEAYHFMRRQAMSRRVSLSAVAAAIVDSQQLLG
jgi:AmiR/NasT family two-component response regulator